MAAAFSRIWMAARNCSGDVISVHGRKCSGPAGSEPVGANRTAYLLGAGEQRDMWKGWPSDRAASNRRFALCSPQEEKRGGPMSTARISIYGLTRLWRRGSIAFRRRGPRLKKVQIDPCGANWVVSIAFRRLGPPARRLPNPLAGGAAKAVQDTTAGLGHFGTGPQRARTRTNLHNSLAFDQLGHRSGASLFWRILGRDLIRGSRGLFRSRP